MPINSPYERRQTLAECLRKREIDACIVSDPRHVYYLTQFATYRPRFSCFLLVNATGDSAIIMGESQISVAQQFYSDQILTFKDYDLHERMVAYPTYVSKELVAKIRQVRLTRERSVVGIEYSHLPHVYAQEMTKQLQLQLTDISEMLLSLRKVKGLDEQLYIAEACAKIDRAYSIARSHVRIGNSENDLYREVIDDAIRRLGFFHGVGGDTWISGERSLLRSGPPTNRKFTEGDTVILDLQATSKSYWSDTCRTFVVGQPSVNQAHVLEVLIRALEKGETLLRPGVRGGDIYQAVQAEIAAAGYGQYSPDHIGHGIGLDDQEPPFFLPSSTEELEEGVVCAIEPGIFAPNIGGGMRIEDNYIIRKRGFEKISRYPILLA